MLDTCNVMTIAATNLREISARLDKTFKNYGKTRVANDESDATLNLKGHWINNIRLKYKSEYDTTIFIDFSYPKFFYKDNKLLITTEQQRKEVNESLLSLIKEFSNDHSLKMNNINYLRVDVAHQFEDIFEDYYLIFSMLYETFIETMGSDKKSKKYIQIENNKIYPQDYTTGFTYSRGEYKINIYNKTAQSDRKEYIPGKKSIIRVEQVFTKKILLKKVLNLENSSSIDKFTMKKLKQAYSLFLEEKLWDRLNYVLATKHQELQNRVIKTLKNSSRELKAKIKDMQPLIIDYEMIRNIIKEADIKAKERMKRYYCNWVKESLQSTESNGGTKIRFFNNFLRLEKILFNITSIKTKVEFIQGIPKIDSSK